MTIEDLQHIFKKQIDDKEKELYYMLMDGDYTLIDRHPPDELHTLLPLLDSFQYAGSTADMPRFKK